VIDRRMQEAGEAVATLTELKLDDEEVQKAEKERIEAMTDPQKEKFGHERRELLAKARPNLFSLRYLEAYADLAEKRYEDALTKLEQLDSDFGARRNALTLRGELLQRLQRWDESRAAFAEALALDSEAPGPLLGMARAALAARDYEATILHARTSLGLLYFQPKGHYIIGLAHFRLGELAAAKDAFLTCVTQAPLFAAGFRMLGQIARFEHDAIGQSQNALRLKHSRERLAALRDSKFAELQQLSARPLHGGDDPENRPMPELLPRPEALAGVAPEELITLVSGLPRSGTSLMMQLLEAAGLPAFTDGRRVADDSNQNGYYEHDQVAALLTSPDKSWLAGARGHSLKVVAPLLAALPLKIQSPQSPIPNPLSPFSSLHYRVLFMEREMEEILASQDSMLTRLGKPTHPGADIAKAYRQQVRHAKTWLTGRGIPAMSVSYADLVHRPDEALPPLAAFLGVPEKLAAMRAVIDPTLHRARRGAELGCSIRSGDLTVAPSSPAA
jgi:tetratricopeptide (TPR) repeat protein